MNVLLGAASMLLAGCHSQKNVVKQEPSEPAPKPVDEVPEGHVICLYGVPADRYRPVQPQNTDTVTADELFNDTVAPQQIEQRDSIPPRPMLKYGVPNPRPRL